MGGFEIYLRICSSISLIGAALGTASFFYTLDAIGWKNVKLRTSNTLNKQTCLINQYFFLVISHFFFGIVEVLMVVYELLLVISPVKFKYPKNGFARGFFYILCGFIVLGVAANLGIAAGVITLVAAVLTLVNTILIKADCMRMEGNTVKIEEAEQK